MQAASLNDEEKVDEGPTTKRARKTAGCNPFSYT